MKDFSLDFIGIGAARSGTTWIAACLKEHPEICLSVPKELHYFARKTLTSHSNRELGDEWYISKFDHCEVDQKKGEVSTSYLADDEVPELLFKNFPDTKLIVSFRNPVNALYSHYHHSRTIYKLPKTFEAFLEKYPEFIEYYKYPQHVKRYLKTFGADKLHFILFDDIESNPDRVIKDLYDSIGVDSSFIPPSLHEKQNENNAPRVPIIRNTLHWIKSLLDSASFVRRLYKRLRLEELGAKIISINSCKKRVKPMNDETRNKLMGIYREDNIELEQLIGKKTSMWN